MGVRKALIRKTDSTTNPFQFHTRIKTRVLPAIQELVVGRPIVHQGVTKETDLDVTALQAYMSSLEHKTCS